MTASSEECNMEHRVTQSFHRTLDPQQLRQELQHDESPDLWRRHAIIGLSMIGMASSAVVSLFQAGLIPHLPDPPIDGFHSDKVNSSNTAYHFGVPDGTLSLAGHATTIALAAYGGRDRARTAPWTPLVAAGVMAAEAAVAGKYLLYQMPVVEKKACGYCIVDALAHLGAFALALPEARTALSTLWE
jgi:uncharacterized membrane protein